MHQPETEVSDFASLLDAAAAAEQAALKLDAAAFLPFSLIWPETRSAYLAWLAQHTAQGYCYSQGEIWKSFALELAGQSIKLLGKIDRIDQLGAAKGGGLLLMTFAIIQLVPGGPIEQVIAKMQGTATDSTARISGNSGNEAGGNNQAQAGSRCRDLATRMSMSTGPAWRLRSDSAFFKASRMNDMAA